MCQFRHTSSERHSSILRGFYFQKKTPLPGRQGPPDRPASYAGGVLVLNATRWLPEAWEWLHVTPIDPPFSGKARALYGASNGEKVVVAYSPLAVMKGVKEVEGDEQTRND